MKHVLLTALAAIVMAPALLVYGLIYFMAWAGDRWERRLRRRAGG